MTFPLIKEPEFIDIQKTRVRFKLVTENGVTSTAELKVPDNWARGVNPYWDRILDEFDVEQMRKARNDLENRRKRQEEFEKKKRAAAVENEKLKQLFDNKMKAFEMPFISGAPDDIKSAIRRAPNQLILNSIIHNQMMEFMNEKGFTFTQLFDYMDELEEQKELEAQQAQTTSS